MNLLKALATVVASGLLLAGGSVVAAEAHTTGIHDNCTNLNNTYPHGVGTRHARDQTSGTPVTSFKRSNRIYWAAENHNGTLDADNDHIACEQA